VTASLVSNVTHGTLTLNSDGSLTYTPSLHYVGSDSFTYTASDGALTSNVATVTISVTNQAPVVTNPGNQTSAHNDVPEFVVINGSDADGDILTYSATGLPPGLSIDSTSGIISGTISSTADT